jgi:hypothetical protein
MSIENRVGVEKVTEVAACGGDHTQNSPSAFIDSVQSGPRQATHASTFSCNPRQVVRNGPARLMSPVQRSMLASLSISELYVNPAPRSDGSFRAGC